jgi:hypothetical protein
MPEPCDCLNYCGDDPWLADGRSYPCAEKKRSDAAAARAARREDRTRSLLAELGHPGDVLGALRELKTLRNSCN